ncbi:hypothetical protein VDG1235_4119 [Verrucomicrobiia bacterium DG1235]|nr:hypothetical protein VDG1235_4119 [Verrucomicrobiae bacterium DG1235]
MFNRILSLFRKPAVKWYEPEDPTPREHCPCCDYISLPERGNYLICPICFWEDDGQDLEEIDDESGPNNGITLREGRKNFEEFGACEKEMLKYVISKEERSEFEYTKRTTI